MGLGTEGVRFPVLGVCPRTARRAFPLASLGASTPGTTVRRPGACGFDDPSRRGPAPAGTETLPSAGPRNGHLWPGTPRLGLGGGCHCDRILGGASRSKAELGLAYVRL